MKFPCPRCHAPMSIKPRYISEEEYGIKCSMCRWQYVIISGSREKIKKTLRLQKQRRKKGDK